MLLILEPKNTFPEFPLFSAEAEQHSDLRSGSDRVQLSPSRLPAEENSKCTGAWLPAGIHVLTPAWAGITLEYPHAFS